MKKINCKKKRLNEKGKLSGNKHKNTNINWLWLLPCSIILSLVLITQVSYFVFEFVVSTKLMEAIDKGEISDDTVNIISEFLNTFDKQSITLGLDIIGIAVSVWIGLNIYNIIKKDSLQNLMQKAEKLKDDFDVFTSDYIDFNFISLENAIVTEDRVNFGFLKLFKSFSKDTLNYKITKYIVLIEKTLKNIIVNFDSQQYVAMDLYLDEFKNEIEKIEKSVKCFDGTNDIGELKIINSYILCRHGDFYYYTGMKMYKQGFTDKAKGCLTKAKEYYDEVLEGVSIDDLDVEQTIHSYIYNTCSYINNIMYHISDKKYLDEAYNCSKKACSDKNGDLIETGYARDHRNFGVNNEIYIKTFDEDEWYTGMFFSLSQYNIAFNINKNDVNTLTSITSCILKILDKIIGIASAEYCVVEDILKKPDDIIKKLESFDFQKYTDCEFKSVREMIDRANSCITVARINYPDHISARYHAIHVYMYLFLLANKKEEKNSFKQKGIDEIKLCEVLQLYNNEKSIPFLYKARNFFCAVNKIKESNKYNSTI